MAAGRLRLERPGALVLDRPAGRPDPGRRQLRLLGRQRAARGLRLRQRAVARCKRVSKVRRKRVASLAKYHAGIGNRQNRVRGAKIHRGERRREGVGSAGGYDLIDIVQRRRAIDRINQ